MIIENGQIMHIRSSDSSEIKKGSEEQGVDTQDLENRIVLPGFIDGHVHLLLFGQGLKKLSLRHCTSLSDIRATIRSYASANPQLKRILCTGWMRWMVDEEATAAALDDLDPRPILIDSKDLHSTWVNTQALRELGCLSSPDLPGGSFSRDADGNLTGQLHETCVTTIVWPYLARVASLQENLEALKAAFLAFLSAGYTGVIDMAMDEIAWSALQEYRQTSELPIRVAAHWLITPSLTEAENLSQVDRAIELYQQYNRETSPWCRIAGIKIITDGIIDGCTAALSKPYTSNGADPGPFWNFEQLAPLVRKADGAGLQIALHAIGDAAITMCINVLEQHASPGHRHRIEHLELASPEDAARLGRLGITASIQPVHADPAILRAWPSLLGDERCERAFAYTEFAEGGANLALGTDAPTAPNSAFENLYIATTRRSAREPALEDMVNEKFALGLEQAVRGATLGTAYSCFMEGETGSLEAGKQADFVLVDGVWEKDLLLGFKAVETWVGGRKVYEA
ncbi:amidohydrolase 3 [Patellaria atrata CBS 101060]|uniref:Amidohydrolase 3 n=1 Tax=Patellaria atrata CBS 101060 TaxID=1346257 RepID=A0A9P4SDY1_9PEZI|nr:amidohydrolase 3 [Patellaria atrata CBS 101060]